RLRYARAAARAMVRGLPSAEADARLAKERAEAKAGSELDFALDLRRRLLVIHDEHPGKDVRSDLVALFDAQKQSERRRALMLDAVEVATQHKADGIIEGLAEHYLDSLPPGTGERRRAERLYTQAIVGRAFRRRAAEKFDEARADFEAVARRTGSLEA